jgi:hypothetical protein
MPPFPQGVDPRFAWVGSAACTAFELGPPREPDSRVTSRSAFLVAVLRYEGERFGARSGDRSGVCRAAQAFEEIVLQAQKPGELKGKRATKRLLGIP